MLWKTLAKILARPSGLAWVVRNSNQKPYFHLEGYMDRWWLTPKFLLTKDEHGNLFPYDWVPMILKIRVHHILRADVGRCLHDHPCDNLSVILKGWYDEQDIFGRSNIRSTGETVLRRAECFHKIVAMPQDGVWTLWFMGRYRQRWGFLVEGCKVDYRRYLEL